MSFKILYTSDLHGNRSFYERLFQKGTSDDCKAIVIGGDLCPRTQKTKQNLIREQRSFLEDFFMPLCNRFKKPVYAIMGNDDFRINEIILKQENITLNYLHMQRFSLFSKQIVGYGFVNPTPFRLKDWEKFENEDEHMPEQMFDHAITTIEPETGTIEQDMKQLKKMSMPHSTIYVMHAPPFNTKLDMLHDGTHVGSTAIRTFIENEQPFLTLHGHIHESPQVSGSWIDKIGNTTCINVGSSYPKDRLNAIMIDLANLDMKYLEL